MEKEEKGPKKEEKGWKRKKRRTERIEKGKKDTKEQKKEVKTFFSYGLEIIYSDLSKEYKKSLFLCFPSNYSRTLIGSAAGCAYHGANKGQT